MTPNLKPILKWVGGKTQLLPVLRNLIISEGLHHPITNGELPYIEPFIGGGALFLDLQPSNAWINDKNEDLIRFYQTVRDYASETITSFDSFVAAAKRSNLEQFYYVLRDAKNIVKLDYIHAARFYYLNKACFNGLFRVNSSGEFNVPFNKSVTPPSIDCDNFYAVSNFLKQSNTRITNLDAVQLLRSIGARQSFIYLDPPYVPVKKNSFVGYTSCIDKTFHEQLAEIAHKLAREGHYVLMSNSNCDEVHRLYASDTFRVHAVDARGSVNSNGNDRKRTETIICNF